MWKVQENKIIQYLKGHWDIFYNHITFWCVTDSYIALMNAQKGNRQWLWVPYISLCDFKILLSCEWL